MSKPCGSRTPLVRAVWLAALLALGAGCAGDGGSSRDRGPAEVVPVEGGGALMIGAACSSDGACGSHGGTKLVCMTEHSGVTWKDGYCLLECDTKSPSCPKGSTCADEPIYTALDRAYCFLDCTGSGAPDCRTGYWCSVGGTGVCYPKAGS
jgi:hypothetical protein